MSRFFNLYSILAGVIVLFTIIPVHEYAHGYVAYKLGDFTAKSSGRLTLNPFDHFDLLGGLLLVFTGFGWAKPIPINPFYFKDRKVGMALTAIAGPIANILLAYIVLLIYRLFANVAMITALNPTAVMVISTVLTQIASISVYLAVFNLIPIPPLDGSRIITLFLPERYYFKLMEYERYIFIILFILIFTGILSGPLSFVSGFIVNGLFKLTGFVDIFFRGFLL